MGNFNFYLTSIEPSIGQSISSQSIGGYCSLSELYPKAEVSTSVVGLYDTSFILKTFDNNFVDKIKTEDSYISINNEIIKVDSFDENTGEISVSMRGHNEILNIHKENDYVFVISSLELFNDVFDINNKQYRCLAIKNDSYDKTLNNVRVFISKNSRNVNSQIRISIEEPKSQYLSSISSDRDEIRLVDEGLIGQYDDDHFAECLIKIDGENDNIVRSFDSETGTFVFYSSFASVGEEDKEKSYEVFPSPSERIKSGVDVPDGEFSFSDSDNPIIVTEENIFPNDIIYLWVERKVSKGYDSFKNNDFNINVFYEEDGQCS